MNTCLDYKPDHNGECLNCDEPMSQHIESLRQFYSMLTTLELVALRHDAVQLNDLETKKLIDEELKKRVEGK